MKLAILAPGDSVHTERWVNALAANGHELHLITMHPVETALNSSIRVHVLPFRGPVGYYLNCWSLKKLIEALEPDLLHVHCASGYGTLGRLSGFHPLILSLWGSDIFVFPKKSSFNRRVLIKNLLNADLVCSTSNAMAEQARIISPQLEAPLVTPFGVDTDRFIPRDRLEQDTNVVVGTVKALDPVYGVDVLLRAFKLVKEALHLEDSQMAKRVRLLIVGKGPQSSELQALAEELAITDSVTFQGAVPHAVVPAVLQQIDIFVAASRSESFGVSVLEASSAGRPVIVTDVGGLPEVVRHDTTGIIVPAEDTQQLGSAILSLVKNLHRRERMGAAGREFVVAHYSWDHCVHLMERVYDRFRTGSDVSGGGERQLRIAKGSGKVAGTSPSD